MIIPLKIQRCSSNSSLKPIVLNANYVNVSKGLISYIYEKDMLLCRQDQSLKSWPPLVAKNQQTTPPHTHTHI